MTQISRPQQFTGSRIRDFMFGSGDHSLEVLRQAWRVWPDDSDEMVLAQRGPDYWVARRLSDQVTIWACPDDVAADEQFEQLADPAEGWLEAQASADALSESVH